MTKNIKCSDSKPAVKVLEEFRRLEGNYPLLAFHAAFDEAMLISTHSSFGLKHLHNEWLDIALLARITRLNPKI
ncbi:hypothetical protein [Polynucleobacter hallstattensis]|uniref:hypothetical protein n=1 Tax=Polynucleobacter hallstattensis TaxID=1855586 RepID=UPI001C0B2692|nr:hypothetical protein [Polynucleobacter hallstattensis]MBU3561161.1 hypothetical protein [Polynucleobacter hallstattensis]